jgi:hypothetical protein
LCATVKGEGAAEVEVAGILRAGREREMEKSGVGLILAVVVRDEVRWRMNRAGR